MLNTAQGNISETFTDVAASRIYPSQCYWIIAPPGALQVTITLTVVPNTFFSYDVNCGIFVYECWKPNCLLQPYVSEGKQLTSGLYGVHSIPLKITSSTGWMKVVLRSKGTYGSFQASWSLVCQFCLFYSSERSFCHGRMSSFLLCTCDDACIISCSDFSSSNLNLQFVDSSSSSLACMLHAMAHT